MLGTITMSKNINREHQQIRPVRCPKCRSVDICLRELIVCGSRWYPGATEGFHDTGEYFKVEGECEECGHGWTLRGYKQVWTELRERLAENDRLLKKQS